MKLLHYTKTLFGKIQSRVKGDRFFLSPNGGSNPLEELKANIEASISNSTYPCRFPARFAFLKKYGLIEQKDFSHSTDICMEFKNWVLRFQATSVDVIYASQYMSNPSSALGHTFLRFNAPDRPSNINPVLNYAAEVPPNVGFIEFSYKGLFGGFLGSFAVAPFYGKFHEYINHESRDLWEYHLNFSPKEIDLLIEHMWELMKNGQSYYYFLDENCSLILLDSLNVVRPDESLSDEIHTYVLPLETVKVLHRKKWISDFSFRPSLRNQLLQKIKKLTHQQRNDLSSILNKSIEVSQICDINLLETLIDYLNYNKYKNFGVQKTYEKKILREALLTRAKLGSSVLANTEIHAHTVPIAPHLSHYPHHVSLRPGIASSGSFLELSLYPSIHEIMNRDHGYIQFSEITLMNPVFRYEFTKNKFLLESLQIFKISNFVPYSRYDPMPSWRLALGIHSQKTKNCINCTMIQLKPAFGLGFPIDEKNQHFFYSMLDMSLETREPYKPAARLLVGPEFNYFWVPSEVIKFLITYQLQFTTVPTGWPQTQHRAQIRGTYSFSPKFELGLDLLWIGQNPSYLLKPTSSWFEAKTYGSFFFYF